MPTHTGGWTPIVSFYHSDVILSFLCHSIVEWESRYADTPWRVDPYGVIPMSFFHFGIIQ